ncbi:MAG: DNA gyrase/topoisomerase IV subunit A, partial [Bacteroidales bacterium]|nr:DNA gyrase/topoisomerase IV subunit A [Bacteroidales bacterium]
MITEDIDIDDALEDKPLEGEEQSSGKYEKVLKDGEKKYRLAGMYKNWFLDYASYVILERAVPHIEDGLKPVQRRILHALYRQEDGRFHKVSNVVGYAMRFHPHGDASIKDALVQLGQKNLMVDTQGNWGNILTGDSAAAGRYIEARLSKFALDVAFNPKITEWALSYDGGDKEPVTLPVKFPLLLAQGSEGIAVGLAEKILPHNFNELLDASIAYLRGEDFVLYPDFPTGGIADCSKYNNGLRGGQVKVRARIEKIDKHTIAITEIPYGTTTSTLIDSIIKANDNGKIRIRKIDDNTAATAKIVIHLPADVSPDKTIDALYAFSDCEVSLKPNACVISGGKPCFMGIDEILKYNTDHTLELFRKELNIQLGELEDQWHRSSLEKIFFEKKVYRILEDDARSWDDQIAEIENKMLEYQPLLHKEIRHEDILELVKLPVRKISKFDIKAADEKIRGIEADMEEVGNNLEHLVDFTIRFFGYLKKKYGANFPRRTEIAALDAIQAAKVVASNAKLYVNVKEGFVGIGAIMRKDENAECVCECSDIDDLIIFLKSGIYKVVKCSDKLFVGKDIIHAAVFHRNDGRNVYNAVYRDGKGGSYFVKRFSVTGVTRDREYDLTQGKEGSYVAWFTSNGNGEAETVNVYLRPKPKLKKLSFKYDFSTLAIKGRSSRGNLLTKNAVRTIQLSKAGVSTIGGKEIWFDTDINRLNEDGRGLLLGEFFDGDRILVVCRDGTYHTSSFDLSNHYQGDILLIEKFDPGKIFTALYYDGEKYFYVKRFRFEPSDNNVQKFISDGPGSYLAALSKDAFPQVEIKFEGKNSGRDDESVDIAHFIACKGIGAKGKRMSNLDVASVRFIEPLAVESEPESRPELEPES